MLYRVGDRIMHPSPDGVLFDMTDGGGILSIIMSQPTAAEKRAFNAGLSLRLAVVEDIIFVLVRMGSMQWMDAPYYRRLSIHLTRLEDVPDGAGYGIHAMLVDGATGVLVAQKIVSTTTSGARSLRAAVLRQPDIEDYRQRLRIVTTMYSSKDLADGGIDLC